MNRRMVDVIGGVATVAILLLGVLAFALPLFTGAGSTMSDAADVRAQNSTQQTLLDSLTAQAATIAEVEQEVAELRAGIPATGHVEDLIELATAATDAHGGTLTAVTPAPAAAFAPRVTEPGTDPSAAAPAPEDAPGEESAGTVDAADAADAPAPASPPVDAPGDAAQQTEVTLEFDVPGVDAGTAIVDALRAGPRLVAVTRVEVAATGDQVTLTVTVLVFSRPDA
jgi:hypothetical protein